MHPCLALSQLLRPIGNMIAGAVRLAAMRMPARGMRLAAQRVTVVDPRWSAPVRVPSAARAAGYATAVRIGNLTAAQPKKKVRTSACAATDH